MSTLRFFLRRLRSLVALAPLVMLTASAAPVEITMMIAPNDPLRPVWKKTQDEFNQSHPNIRFHILWSDIRPKLNLLMVAGALPDLLITADQELVNVHQQLRDVDDLLNSAPADKEQIYPSLLESCKYEGALKMVPISYNAPFIFYRPDLFKKAGIPEPTADWTWDDYRRDAKALTERNPDGTVKVWGTDVFTVWWVEWLSMIRQGGADLMAEDGKIELNSPGTLKAMQFMHDLIYVDQSAPKPRDLMRFAFENGRVAIYYGGHVQELPYLQKNPPGEWDIAPLPAGPAGRATGELAVQGVGISIQCQHPEAAAEIVRYLMSKDVSMELAQGGIMVPVRRDVAQATLLSGVTVPAHARVLVDSLDFARPVPKSKAFYYVWMTVNDYVNQALNNPDDSHLPELPALLATQAQIQLDLLKTQSSTSFVYFILQVIVLAAVGIWLLRRFLKNNPQTPEEKAGQKYFFLFASPCLLGLCLFTIWPLLLSFWWAQTDYNMVDAPRYVGASQYETLLFKDPEFWHSLRLSLVYAIVAVPLGLLVSLGAALLLNQNLRYIGPFRVLFYLPTILPVAASGVMWVWLLNPQFGIVNQTLRFFGLPGPGWVQDPHWALPALVLISLWGFGGAMLIFLAGLKNIPESLYEAARIDGAGALSQFRHITLPSLSPVMFFNLTMGCIGALQVFDIAYIVSTAEGGDTMAGGPEKATNFYVLYLYVKSFEKLQMGTGSAMAWLFFVLIMLITLVNFWAKRYWLAPEDERA